MVPLHGSPPPSRCLMTLLTFTFALLSSLQCSQSTSSFEVDERFENTPVLQSSLASSSSSSSLIQNIQNESIEESQRNEEPHDHQQQQDEHQQLPHGKDAPPTKTAKAAPPPPGTATGAPTTTPATPKAPLKAAPSAPAAPTNIHPTPKFAPITPPARIARPLRGDVTGAAFDEACHAVGSLHGCATGVNCYAIDRCQRLEPEKVADGGIFSASSFTGVGPVVKVVLGIVVGLVLCCSTVCLVGASAVKCAVDDLVGEEGGDYMGRTVAAGRNDDAEEEQDELEIALLRQPISEGVPDNIKVENGEEEENTNRNTNYTSPGENVSISQRSRISTTTSAARRKPKGSSIRRMFFACQICYLTIFLVTGILAIVSLSYAPRQPQYNVCTDQLAWKSIVEGMASLKMSASFDLLISVYNPNRFEVDLDNGSGQFHHDGEYVGSFAIPSAKISAKAISDMVVKVSFTPDKWAALSLTSEYYRGTLKFMVGGHTHVKIPGLGNYQFDAKFDDVLVNVNDPELDDTHLCACPGWKKPVEEEFDD
eukprot:CAMPEP_0171332206 /NCGR_PEP_ID=MMETSP0878-20121228/3212_1 /TAXON_ID=67004 /ORGANISM="Thalassiosira weissflogii, Strain CCMP1336" /LENGTH=537 /DNA_ID=CAMNT_0011832905 /DNA_START=164 /DNA_END=1777 /DNA_ORIENTATION=+